MNILFDDIVQYSDADASLKSPALAETFEVENGTITINFDKPRIINSIGLGNTDGSVFSISAGFRIFDGGFPSTTNYLYNFNGGFPSSAFTHIIDGGGVTSRNNFSGQLNFSGNGLYLLGRSIPANRIIITCNARYIGRLGAGLAVNIPTAIAKEPAFNSTASPRVTLGGQVIAGLGGYHFRSVSLDSRYKIGKAAMREIENGYNSIGMGYPFFIDLSTESYKLPFNKLYAAERNQQHMSFESGVRRFLYSRRFELEERF